MRTIGALFSVYWLMRLSLPSVGGSALLDGQRGFAFGVNAEWCPPSEQDVLQALSLVQDDALGVRCVPTRSGAVV